MIESVWSWVWGVTFHSHTAFFCLKKSPGRVPTNPRNKLNHNDMGKKTQEQCKETDS